MISWEPSPLVLSQTGSKNMNVMDGWSCIVLCQFVIDENIQFNGCWEAETCLCVTEADIVKSYVII